MGPRFSVFGAVLISLAAFAQTAAGIETEELFAFASGSDVGERGEREYSLGFEPAFGKRGGTFRNLAPTLELGFTPTDRLHVAIEAWAEHFLVRNNPDFDNQNRWGGGVALEIKAQLQERSDRTPVGVAILVAPHYATSEETSGEPAKNYALEVNLIADVELSKRAVSAFNLVYEIERVKPRGAPWERESVIGAVASTMIQFSPHFLAGGEVQYFRKYDGYFLETFLGHALYVGPSVHVVLGDHLSVTAGWATQVAGRALDVPGSLDLVNFPRHRAKLKLIGHF